MVRGFAGFAHGITPGGDDLGHLVGAIRWPVRPPGGLPGAHNLQPKAPLRLAKAGAAHYHVPMPQLIASVEGVEIKHVYLQKDRTTLGRHPDNDIVFDNMVVSGHHCIFDLRGLADVFIEDLRSTNGTYINGQMVKRQQLHDGEVIAIGNFRIQFLTASERPSGFSETAAMKFDPLGMPARSHAVFQVLNGSSQGLEMPVVKAVTTFGKPGISVVSVSHRRDGYYVAHLDGASQPILNGDAIGAQPVLLSNHDVLELASTRMLFLLKE
jgi:hypothetical protein